MQCPLRLLGGVHQLPALFERRGGGNFDSDVLAVLHGVNGHRDVQLPRGHDVHQVDVVTLAKLFPALLAAVRSRLGKSAAHENRLRAVHALGIKVAQGFDLDAVEVREAFHSPGAAHAQPIKPTRTVSIGAVLSPSTDFWPGSRAGVSKTITPSTVFHTFDSQPENRRMPPRAASKMSNFFISMTDWLVSLQKYEIF